MQGFGHDGAYRIKEDSRPGIETRAGMGIYILYCSTSLLDHLSQLSGRVQLSDFGQRLRFDLACVSGSTKLGVALDANLLGRGTGSLGTRLALHLWWLLPLCLVRLRL